ncbi:hypothetical protein [Halosegnis longus]|uniref:Uncharacterized protein n=1 Tax=Halosegnis longus TaxID=2216012 RepID=A0AAJ4UV74_9EURY|nr:MULTISPECIES: hypothetical protein [Halobacteriales]RNJ25629.1 hypothetical protein Nmn1133_02295 [Salella cibi]
MAGFIQNTIQGVIEYFGGVIMQSPEQALLVAVGGLIVGGASAVFGVLSLGAAVSLVGRALPTAGPPEQ